MHKTSVYLTDAQHEALAKRAEELGIQPSELLRRILDNHFGIAQT